MCMHMLCNGIVCADRLVRGVNQVTCTCYLVITPHQAVGADYAVGARVHDMLHASLGPGTVVYASAGPAHSSVETRVRFDGGQGVHTHLYEDAYMHVCRRSGRAPALAELLTLNPKIASRACVTWLSPPQRRRVELLAGLHVLPSPIR